MNYTRELLKHELDRIVQERQRVETLARDHEIKAMQQRERRNQLEAMEADVRYVLASLEPPQTREAT